MKSYDKKITFILLFLFSVVINAQVEDLLKSGNSLFQEEKFDEAIIQYEKVIEQGYESDVLYYNLGNSYYRNNQLGKAILNYEKGLKLSPGNEDLIYNLNIARAHTVDKIEVVPKIFIAEWWEILLTSLSVSEWAAILILLFVTLLIFSAIYLLGKTGSALRNAFLLATFNLTIFLFVVVVFIARVDREASSESGIILSSTVSVKLSPNVNSDDSFILHEGTKFVIRDQVDDWLQVKIDDGKIGWLREIEIGRI